MFFGITKVAVGLWWRGLLSTGIVPIGEDVVEDGAWYPPMREEPHDGWIRVL
jgi:hypothetical protein